MTKTGLLFSFIFVYVTEVLAKQLHCPPVPSDQCMKMGSPVDEHFFEVKGQNLVITYGEARHFHLICREDLQLEDPALPRFDSIVSVPLVKLTDCAPPANGYAKALLNLNVTVAAQLVLTNLPVQPTLNATYLHGISVTGFKIVAAETIRADPSLFESLTGLRDLRLTRVTLPATTALRLPKGLRSIILKNSTAEGLTGAMFARLPLLVRLFIEDKNLRELNVSMALALSNVEVSAPLESVSLAASVRTLKLFDAVSAELHGDCSGLRNVTVERVSQSLPSKWLARCTGVENVSVKNATGALGRDELAGAQSLRRLTVVYCKLSELPEHWLANATELRYLDLSYNTLTHLPSSLASANALLEEVTVSYNKLGRTAVATLAALPHLRSLTLDGNPLADLCGEGDYYVANALSPLWTARTLRSLRMRNTNTTRICRDFRLNLLQLAILDLSNNEITTLERSDLEWRRDSAAEVNLRGNPTRALYTKEDYNAAIAILPAHDVPTNLTTLRMDYKANCDCSEYWFARAWRERPHHASVSLQYLLCNSSSENSLENEQQDLLSMPLDSLQCDVPSACPSGCKCRATGAASELRCENAGLTLVPRVEDLLPPVRTLLLAGNNITHLRPEDVPPQVEILDLSNNNISQLRADTVATLFNARPLSLHLRGNLLDCSCEALPLMQALAAMPQRVVDLPQVRCKDGRPTADAAVRAAAACSNWPLWLVILIALVLALASALGAACLTRPATRHRVKRYLFEHGLCIRWALGASRDDEERAYDAFISFSHLDEPFATELAKRLEAGAVRKMCLHERDWIPGDWIPAQIERSVRSSYRTLVLLSDNFLSSTWAQAELREAYAAALRDACPRLLLLLLPTFNPAAATKDPALRAYLDNVTYLRWDDPHLWEKLELVLPPRTKPTTQNTTLTPTTKNIPNSRPPPPPP